ncbi:hypothetical protein GRF29_1g3204794 [Pseudopithomyces chartarum]|uniref:Heterokaryon incompatibility domain-containing protein n=1 Tax=Pseudopithomyces chartarum TaxID=1892770 RepID=A0AAN6RM79_9PLEO|nr:hypothetical protein GRF29_1g3204794 [Pseudopithomyces chartarum]
MKNIKYPDPHRLARDEIRLIKISSGEWSDPISCELVRDSLSSVRPYHALSYVWGSAQITRPIFLDGQPWNATVNLESALRHLRLQLLPTYLWVDALCINQIDDGERTHQVDLMGTIYRSCKGVLVYLGDGVGRHRRRRMARATQGDPPPIISFSLDQEKLPIRCTSAEGTEDVDKAYLDTLQVFKFIRQLSDAGHIDHSDYIMQRNGLELFESLRQLTHAPFTPWWTRVWVVQEVVLPPEVTLICGSISASWGLFSRAVRQYNYHTQSCCSIVTHTLPRDCLKVLNSFSKKIEDLEEMRCIMSGTVTQHMDGTMILPTSRSDGQISLLSLLRRFKSRKASDPRDKVYALLSLVKDDDNAYKAMNPDYSLTEYEINDTTVTSGNGILYVDCKIVDEVEFVGDIMFSEDPGTVPTTLRDWCNLVDMHELSEEGLGAQHRQLKKIFWRTICADLVYQSNTICRVRPEDESSFACWLLLSTLSPFGPNDEKYLNETQIYDLLQHRSTQTGIGWGESYLSENACMGRDYVNDVEDVLFASNAELNTGEEFDEATRLTRAEAIIYGTLGYRELLKKEREIYRAAKCLEEKFSSRPKDRAVSGNVDVEPNFHKIVQEKRTQAWNQMAWNSFLDRILSQAREKNVPKFSRMNLSYQISRMDRSIVSATKSRRLFITKGRNIGLGPASTKQGDRLCLLKGGRTPFILRHSTSKSGFELIGDCYADGLMNAETLDQRVLEMHKTRLRPSIEGIRTWQTTDDIPQWIWEKAYVANPIPIWQKISLV